MHEQYHTWDKDFVYLPVYLTGGSSNDLLTPYIIEPFIKWSHYLRPFSIHGRKK